MDQARANGIPPAGALAGDDWVCAGLRRIRDAQRRLLATPLADAQRDQVLGIGSVVDELLRGLTPAQPVPEIRPARPAHATGSTRILLVEDGEANRVLATTILAKAGYAVAAVADGMEAVAAVRLEDYALILMDLSLPRMDGYAAAAAIRALPDGRGQMPILAMTGADHVQDLERCRALGMDDLLTKPFVATAVLAGVRRWLGKDGGQIGEPARELAREQAAAEQALVPSPAETPVPAAPLIDDRALSELEADIPAGFLPRLVQTFITEASRRLDTIASAAAAGDMGTAGSEAHAIKGSAATFGAHALRQAALDLEHGARAGQPDLAVQVTAVLDLGRATVAILSQRFPHPPEGA